MEQSQTDGPSYERRQQARREARGAGNDHQQPQQQDRAAGYDRQQPQQHDRQHDRQHPQHDRQQSQVLGPLSGPPQLPPQMFTTAAQLLDMTDKKLLLVMRDGRKFFGVLRSWDQFANLVFQDTIERIYAGKLFADKHVGLFLVRGENVVLLGEIDLDREDDIPAGWAQAPYEEVLALKNEEDIRRKKEDKIRAAALRSLGFEPEHSGEILF
ncbi:Ribonucleoprotein LSM domain eukaryotic/archaea-type [Penicillium taxi]|uniref:Ribonucleoprotein LSM domain eukaryotic/archaea-type n=1 Tax=Penicillium taxi TaxID=168475 RepID=UPI0025456D92|nr:Ribonucleoprotein LSM domain eukaryotic/archaea-type [Penicillium taxi]KAJ5907700.1 Ribonucleoprotein LSM domain eukaryotic/archaea-type [Penicillium taxi]